MVNVDQSLMSSHVTFTWDKISCWRPMYFAHVILAYVVFFAGIACFISRVVRPLKWTHKWFGKLYIIGMLWTTATSLIIHNTGLPPATLVSFIWVLGGLVVGWLVINGHQYIMERSATALVQDKIKSSGIDGDLHTMIQRAKGEIAESKTFWQRFLSLKALHGIIMLVSWINMAGRIFATTPTSDFTCYTYPVYKPIDTPEFKGANQTLTLVPARDPDYDRLPWASMGLVAWGVVMSLGPAAGAAVIGLVFSYFGARGGLKQASPAAVSNYYHTPQP